MKLNLNHKLLIAGAAVLLLVLVAFVVRENMFSKEILRLEILGPDGAKAGDEIEYTVKFKNNGNFALENPKLVFVLPDNSLVEGTSNLISQDLEDLYPGAENFVNIKTRLMGKEDDLKVAKATLSYTPKNLTARYESNTTFTTKITEVPMTLNFDLPSKLEKGKTVEYSVNYFSTIDYPLENLSVKITNPSGFSFVSATPTSLDNQEWRIGTLTKGQGGRIVVRGTVENSEGAMPFSAQLGMWKNGRFVVVKETTREAQTIQPLLLLGQTVNGSTDYVASPGQTLNYQITFNNIGSSPFENLFLVVRLEGQALDMASVQASGGQVRPNDNMVIFDANQNASLRYLGVQQSGAVQFSARVKPDFIPATPGEAAAITTKVNISEISQNFTVKVNAGLGIAQEVFYQNVGIQNTGPTPPATGQTTTYAAAWSIKNYGGTQKNVKVRATLPANVSLTGVVLPSTEAASFSFDSSSREIVWSVGDIAAGTGVNGDPVSLMFQIALTPGISQKGSVVPLIGPARVSGESQSSNQLTTATDSAVDTSLPDDYGHSGGGIVQ